MKPGSMISTNIIYHLLYSRTEQSVGMAIQLAVYSSNDAVSLSLQMVTYGGPKTMMPALMALSLPNGAQ